MLTLDNIVTAMDKEIIYTLSDAGSVKVGNNDFNIMIPCGGDGKASVIVVSDKEFSDKGFIFFTVIEGRFNIYKYYCGNNDEDIDTVLDGRYFVFCHNNLIVLQKR